MNDQHFTAVASERRRDLLLSLQKESPQHLDLRVDGDSDRAIRLYHVHLPKLDGWGFIKWDRDDHQVSRGRNYAELDPLLELLQANGSSPTP